MRLKHCACIYMYNKRITFTGSFLLFLLIFDLVQHVHTAAMKEICIKFIPIENVMYDRVLTSTNASVSSLDLSMTGRSLPATILTFTLAGILDLQFKVLLIIAPLNYKHMCHYFISNTLQSLYKHKDPHIVFKTVWVEYSPGDCFIDFLHKTVQDMHSRPK